MLLFGIYFLLTIFKAPDLFLSPRFWAEDGVIYYLQARVLPIYEALWAMPLNYLSLPPNLAGILASKLPLLYAPYTNLIISLLIQLLLFWVILGNYFFAGNRAKQGMFLLIPILIIQSFETWLNSINSQVWLALIAACILAAPTGNFTRQRHTLNIFALLLAGLAGVITAFLAPLFILRGLLECRWTWFIYAIPVSLGGIIMLMYGDQGRSVSFPLDIFAIKSFLQILLNNLCFPCATWLIQNIAIIGSGYAAITTMLLLVLAYLVVWINILITGRWLLTASLLLLILSFAGALGKEQWLLLPSETGTRYFFVPAVLFFSSLLFMSSPKKQKMATFVLIVFFINGIYTGKQLGVVGEYDGKNWKQSINDFRQNKSSIIYFNKPFCGFTPVVATSTAESFQILQHSSSEITVGASRIESLLNPQVFLYRFSTEHPKIFQYYSKGKWVNSRLYLFGAKEYAQCYGGDVPLPAEGISIKGKQIVVNRAMMKDASGHQFMFGYGENFAEMLANKTFIYFAGHDVQY